MCLSSEKPLLNFSSWNKLWVKVIPHQDQESPEGS